MWKHFVFVYNNNNGTAKIYVDGVEELSTTVSQDIPYITRSRSHIGNDSNWSGYGGLHGTIKTVNIWQRALSLEEITHLYKSGRYYNVYVSGHLVNIDNSGTPVTSYYKSLLELNSVSKEELTRNLEHSVDI